MDPIVAARLEQKVINLRSQGMLPPKIVAKLAAEGHDLSKADVYQILQARAREVRQQSAALASTRYLRHDEILTRLIDRLYTKLLEGFDRDVARALTALLERQARQLGLDACKAGNDNESWLDEKADADLVSLLRQRYGLTVPDDILDPSRN